MFNRNSDTVKNEDVTQLFTYIDLELSKVCISY